jgi:hypothetical protein
LAYFRRKGRRNPAQEGNTKQLKNNIWRKFLDDTFARIAAWHERPRRLYRGTFPPREMPANYFFLPNFRFRRKAFFRPDYSEKFFVQVMNVGQEDGTIIIKTADAPKATLICQDALSVAFAEADLLRDFI